jgi:5'-methylthioinosine phosphorylase
MTANPELDANSDVSLQKGELMLAIVGGSGLSQLTALESMRRLLARTPYGEPSGPLTFGQFGGTPVIFIARHGYGHTIPSHRINYRANLWALREHHASRIISVAAVGGIRSEFAPGTIVVPHQLIDYTWGDEHTFFEAGTSVPHIDFTDPYSQAVRASVIAAARACGEPIIERAVYAATQGPRLDTAAEIVRFERDGADIVGMTAMPEAALARELEIPYASVVVVSNFAAGYGGASARIDMHEIEQVLRWGMARVSRIIEKVAEAGA